MAYLNQTNTVPHTQTNIVTKADLHNCSMFNLHTLIIYLSLHRAEHRELCWPISCVYLHYLFGVWITVIAVKIVLSRAAYSPSIEYIVSFTQKNKNGPCLHIFDVLVGSFYRTWLWLCLGFPWTILDSGHNVVSSAMTELTNSLPLSDCTIHGAAHVRKISVKW
jgi:hypothetical protein